MLFSSIILSSCEYLYKAFSRTTQLLAIVSKLKTVIKLNNELKISINSVVVIVWIFKSIIMIPIRKFNQYN